MRYVKAFGLYLLAIASLLGLSGNAVASTLTSPAGWVYTGDIHAETAGHVILHSEAAPTPFTAECKSTLGLNVDHHGMVVTAGGNIGSLLFNGCTNNVTVTVLKAGSLEFHPTGGGNATITWSGAEIEVNNHPLKIRCIYTTSNTQVGTLKAEESPKIEIGSSTIPRTGGSAFCGTGGFLTGVYTVTTPKPLLSS